VNVSGNGCRGRGFEIKDKAGDGVVDACAAGERGGVAVRLVGEETDVAVEGGQLVATGIGVAGSPVLAITRAGPVSGTGDSASGDAGDSRPRQDVSVSHVQA
jgi:hypothetical protein